MFARSSVVALGILLALEFVPMAKAADCVIACGKGVCKFENGHELQQLQPGKRFYCSKCESLKFKGESNAVLYGVYQASNGLLNFRAMPGEEVLAKSVRGLAESTCLLGLECMESRAASRRAEIGGLGADEVKTVHEGRPCAIGLPCGPILKPDDGLTFPVNGVDSGIFTLTATRGADRKPVDFAVVGGRISIPASALVAGGVYQYGLKASSLTAPVSGEFSVVATKMQKDIEDDIEDALKENPDAPSLGEIEVLLKEGLQWDATQRLH